MTKSCSCSAAPTLIFACSGAADVGEISDRAARQLTRQGAGKMFCLAGVGGRVSGIIASTAAASTILAIDGCPLNCVKQCLIQAGYAQFEHVQLADIGLAKGKSPANESNVERAVARCCEALSRNAASG